MRCLENEGNSTQPCHKCRKCPKGANLIRHCSKKHESVCSCGKGFFLSIVDNECKLCKQCPSGYGVWRQCSRTRNTVCRKCPSDTFSSVSSNYLGCIKCKKCKSSEILLQECTPGQDTVCIEKRFESNPIYSVSPNNLPSSQLLDEAALPLYLIALVISLCGLLAYLLFQFKLHNLFKSPSFSSSFISPSNRWLKSKSPRCDKSSLCQPHRQIPHLPQAQHHLKHHLFEHSTSFDHLIVESLTREPHSKTSSSINPLYQSQIVNSITLPSIYKAKDYKYPRAANHSSIQSESKSNCKLNQEMSKLDQWSFKCTPSLVLFNKNHKNANF